MPMLAFCSSIKLLMQSSHWINAGHLLPLSKSKKINWPKTTLNVSLAPNKVGKSCLDKPVDAPASPSENCTEYNPRVSWINFNRGTNHIANSVYRIRLFWFLPYRYFPCLEVPSKFSWRNQSYCQGKSPKFMLSDWLLFLIGLWPF